MQTRRTFIKTASAATLALSLPLNILASPNKKLIGIQLYTIREKIKEDFTGTLKHIAKIGYNSVEAAGYSDRKFYGYSPKEYKDICESFGLAATSSHTSVNSENVDQVIEDTLEGGMSYVIIPSLPRDKRQTLDDYKKLADEFNLLGEKCNKNGLGFGYHNHAFEFDKLDGEIPYDILLLNTDPKLVTMELDMYWMVYGGQEPLDYFDKFPGRFGLWHVKDMDADPARESTEIGSGIIDWPKIFAVSEKAGMKMYYVEQESFKMDPFESITKSCDYLKNLKY